MNVLWLILDVADVENLDLMVKLIFVQIVAIELHVLVQVMEVDNIEKDGKLYQVLQILRSSRLRISILSNCICDIGKFKTIERRVNLNADQKRMWFENLSDVNDGKMIDSMPISLSFVDKRTI